MHYSFYWLCCWGIMMFCGLKQRSFEQCKLFQCKLLVVRWRLQLFNFLRPYLFVFCYILGGEIGTIKYIYIYIYRCCRQFLFAVYSIKLSEWQLLLGLEENLWIFMDGRIRGNEQRQCPDSMTVTKVVIQSTLCDHWALRLRYTVKCSQSCNYSLCWYISIINGAITKATKVTSCCFQKTADHVSPPAFSMVLSLCEENIIICGHILMQQYIFRITFEVKIEINELWVVSALRCMSHLDVVISVRMWVIG